LGRITLSFDNGPDPERTPRLLDALGRADVRASFFVVGRELDRPGARAVAQRAHDEGHWIGNHSYSHRVPLGEDGPDAPEREIERAQTSIGDLSHGSRWFRPFGGGGHLDRRLLSPAAVHWLVTGRYSCVLWNCVPRDWERPADWPEHALRCAATRDWSLVVLHDFVEGNDTRVLDFVARCRDAGHDIVQAFPPVCVPLERGAVRTRLDDWVSAGDARQGPAPGPAGRSHS
jgi:peptidoglycan/xylan/chitin deacetylase (PgdA/CDA1 family)